MCDKFSVKSRMGSYEVSFVDDFAPVLGRYRSEEPFLIVDKGVMRFYGDRIKSFFPENRIFTVEAAERHKTVEYCYSVIKTLVRNNVRKNSFIIAIGGGIIQDITAFVSSILFRGVKWIFFPTTLLAQADSCIGSKSSINMGKFKNLLGTFYPPENIFIDINFLDTLPADAVKSGVGEMLHFYFIAGSKLAGKMMGGYGEFVSSPRLLRKYISASLRIKKSFVEIDEFDKDKRNILNYGHTFGHAIETVSGYRINHGQAVTMGMDIANYISLKSGRINALVFKSMHKILLGNMPRFTIGSGNIGNYLSALSKDKKNAGKSLACILTRGPGSMYKARLSPGKKLARMILGYFNAVKGAQSKPGRIRGK